MSDITIILDGKYDIKWKHVLEKKLDTVMIPLGFSRNESSANEDKTSEIHYKQFGVCNRTCPIFGTEHSCGDSCKNI